MQNSSLSYEHDFWGSCANTYWEEAKQIAYARRMGLYPFWGGAHPPTFILGGRSVIDIGGGPVSLLLKTIQRGRAVVADPGDFPPWVRMRYQEAGIEYWRIPGEELMDATRDGVHFDEAWIYNVLQHVEDPERVCKNALELASTIRVFDWVGIDPYEGHPHRLDKETLDEWLEGFGFVSAINENGAVGAAYYGVFGRGRSDGSREEPDAA